MFSSVAYIFSLAVVGVLRFLLFSMKFFVSSENLLFLLVLLFHFLPAPAVQRFSDVVVHIV